MKDFDLVFKTNYLGIAGVDPCSVFSNDLGLLVIFGLDHNSVLSLLLLYLLLKVNLSVVQNLDLSFKLQ